MEVLKGLRGVLTPLIGLALLGLASGACVDGATTDDVPDVAAESAQEVESEIEQSAASAEAPENDEEQPADTAAQPGEKPDA